MEHYAPLTTDELFNTLSQGYDPYSATLGYPHWQYNINNNIQRPHDISNDNYPFPQDDCPF